jgi:hypothetical protein
MALETDTRTSTEAPSEVPRASLPQNLEAVEKTIEILEESFNSPA